MNIEKQILIVEVQYLYWNKSLCYKKPKKQKEKNKNYIYKYSKKGIFKKYV